MKFRKIFPGLLALLLIVLAALAAVGIKLYNNAVARVPDSMFTRAGVEQILSRESVVYYADGERRVGTFFDGAHRDYLPFDSIPPVLVNALVAAEDRNYWEHGGWDFTAFLRAMIDNIRNGGRWRGGSTLTQQATKNIFGRTGPLRGKVDELINAYRLERHFSKREILEFYLNQFFVVGNGHGVSIASRYFFDKHPRDLTLVEAAFIAASVKGPNQYNPFIQETPEARDAALERGRGRVAYVLRQMRREGMIPEAEYREALEQGPEFNRGSFRFSLSTNMMKVKRLLDLPEMQEILEREGLGEYTGAGLRIHTTLDRDIQLAAEQAVYSNLWKLDLVMRGYHPPSDSNSHILSHFEPGEFSVGRVEELVMEEGIPVRLRVRFGALEGSVPRAALEEFFRHWNRHVNGVNALPSARAMTEFAERHLQPGSMVYCNVPYRTPEEMEGDGAGLDTLLELAQRPLLQGAAQVMQEGRVLANVGGFANTGFDRVNQARRQFGSAIKPLVYAAALELGWDPLDPIPNFRQPFRLGGLVYFPRPNHPPEDTVSLAWAARRSENIASVNLLYRLFDKTDFPGFWEACRRIGMAPENFPTRGAFERFVQDSLGFVLKGARLREMRYENAVKDFAIDLTFDGRGREAESLQNLPYGIGFARERASYDLDSIDNEETIQLRLLVRSYLDYATLAAEWLQGDVSGTWLTARHARDGRTGLFVVPPVAPDWRPIPPEEARALPEDELLVGGEVSVATLRRLQEQLRQRVPGEDRYTRENLYASREFRVHAALRHIVAFSRRLDVHSPLKGVLSFPLGVSTISLGEATSAYQVFQEGTRYRTRLGHPQLFIEKIVTADGRVIFEDYAEPEPVLSDRTSRHLDAILAGVVQGGTGRRIGRELRVRLGPGGSSVPVPAYGKTGTTNDYRNAAFLGYMAAPRGQAKGFDPASGYAIGVYTGFDDNRPMNHTGFRGTGSSSSIPAWLDIARNIVKLKDYSARIARAEREEPDTLRAPGEPPLFQREQYRKVRVSVRTGLPITSRENANYQEDLSDELEPGETPPPPTNAAVLWLRDP